VYIASTEDDDALDKIAKKFGVDRESMRCHGCRSDLLGIHCRKCEFRDCVNEKKIENCEDCDDYPCSSLKEFQKKMVHRAELFESMEFRKQNGYEKWFLKIEDDYTCRECGAMNSAYQIRCRKCGAMPGNDFIRRNLDALKKQLGIE